MQEPTDITIRRAVSNALWPALRKRRWQDAKKTRAIHPTGAPRSYTYNGAARIQGPEPTIEVLDHIYYLEATAHSSETRLGYGIAIELTRVAAHQALAQVSAAAAAEYDEALDDRTLRFQHPFIWKGDHYRRNDKLTRRAAIALQAVAAAATVRALTPEEDATLLDDGGMRADEAFAVAHRSKVNDQ